MSPPELEYIVTGKGPCSESIVFAQNSKNNKNGFRWPKAKSFQRELRLGQKNSWMVLKYDAIGHSFKNCSVIYARGWMEEQDKG